MAYRPFIRVCDKWCNYKSFHLAMMPLYSWESVTNGAIIYESVANVAAQVFPSGNGVIIGDSVVNGTIIRVCDNGCNYKSFSNEWASLVNGTIITEFGHLDRMLNTSVQKSTTKQKSVAKRAFIMNNSHWAFSKCGLEPRLPKFFEFQSFIKNTKE